MNYCSKCGKERIDGSSLCGNCGSTDVPITYKKKFMVVSNIINVVLFSMLFGAMLFVNGYLALSDSITVQFVLFGYWLIFLILFINSAILSLIFSIISKHKFTLYASIFVLSLIFFLFFFRF